ncbi:MAG: hypothetical protein AVDCRST_MAG49-50 [uncultured Thermomicrobiales bacterium]|uniref:Methyl-accepting chemotaxis protein n=1 Tax=uncultured Thermomicrobiales bacterium TaxID=1645740 RepID=A0A6J4TWD8_9BACT|nr:MAG: hypothetical protein AVDCRST_MAG49-50 [uncultured Thermomicrobiales bacterium]
MQLRPKATAPGRAPGPSQDPGPDAPDGSNLLQTTARFPVATGGTSSTSGTGGTAGRGGGATGDPFGAARGRGRDDEATLPPLDGGRPIQHPELVGRRELADEIEGMAAAIQEVDPRAAERMTDLSRSIGTEAGRVRWADVDLRRAFNTERIAHAWAVRREGGYASGSIDFASRIRDVLVLVPLLLTWFAFYEASKAYDQYLTNNPDEVRSPFLLLWQRGFGGEGSVLATSFSTVALIDAILIALIILLTFYSQGRRDQRDDKIALTATRFQTDLDNIFGAAAVALANDRAGRPALLAQSVERLAERFERSSANLLSQLQVEHNRLEQVAALREREFADFGVFASGMRAGAEETHRLLVDLRQLSTGLNAALEDLTSEVGIAGDQQRTLLGAVGNLERLVSSGIQSDQAVTRQLTSAAGNLAEAADRALSGSEAAAQAGRIASEAVRGIAELTTALATGQARVESAVATEAEANARLADALRGSNNGVANSAKLLNEIGAGLAQLQDEFARIADQSVSQSETMHQMLNEQGTIANNLTQVARDLSSVGIATAQRQREVNEDLSGLVSRLDGLTTVLTRVTAGTSGAAGFQQPGPVAPRGDPRGDLRGDLQGGNGSYTPPRPVAPAPDPIDRDRDRDRASLWPRANQRRPGQ